MGEAKRAVYWVYTSRILQESVNEREGQGVSKCKTGHKWYSSELGPLRRCSGWMTLLVFLLGWSDLR